MLPNPWFEPILRPGGAPLPWSAPGRAKPRVPEARIAAPFAMKASVVATPRRWLSVAAVTPATTAGPRKPVTRPVRTKRPKQASRSSGGASWTMRVRLAASGAPNRKAIASARTQNQLAVRGQQRDAQPGDPGEREDNGVPRPHARLHRGNREAAGGGAEVHRDPEDQDPLEAHPEDAGGIDGPEHGEGVQPVRLEQPRHQQPGHGRAGGQGAEQGRDTAEPVPLAPAR